MGSQVGMPVGGLTGGSGVVVVRYAA
jgi:hypothetical protein